MDRRENPTPWPEDTKFDDRAMVARFTIDEREFKVAFTWVICGTCDGKGRHVNPAIDSQGLTREDFDNDPGFYEDYMSGVYDQECVECHGRRVVPRLKSPCPELDAYQRDEEDYRRLCEMERRMGC